MRRLPFTLALVLLAGMTLRGVAAEPGDPLVSEAVIDAPVDAVWHAFATREGMESWAVAKSGEVELRIGARWRTSYDAKSNLDDGSVIETEVLAFDPPGIHQPPRPARVSRLDVCHRLPLMTPVEDRDDNRIHRVGSVSTSSMNTRASSGSSRK